MLSHGEAGGLFNSSEIYCRLYSFIDALLLFVVSRDPGCKTWLHTMTFHMFCFVQERPNKEFDLSVSLLLIMSHNIL